MLQPEAELALGRVGLPPASHRLMRSLSYLFCRGKAPRPWTRLEGASPRLPRRSHLPPVISRRCLQVSSSAGGGLADLGPWNNELRVRGIGGFLKGTLPQATELGNGSLGDSLAATGPQPSRGPGLRPARAPVLKRLASTGAPPQGQPCWRCSRAANNWAVGRGWGKQRC